MWRPAKYGATARKNAWSKYSGQAAFWTFRNGAPTSSRRFASPARFSAGMSPSAGNGGAPNEVAWYASTRQGTSAEQYAAATRGHWGVENRVHYILDVSMHEDASRVRKSPTILSILRSFALNILRFNKVNNVADALWRNAMNLNRVLAYSGI